MGAEVDMRAEVVDFDRRGVVDVVVDGAGGQEMFVGKGVRFWSWKFSSKTLIRF